MRSYRRLAPMLLIALLALAGVAWGSTGNTGPPRSQRTATASSVKPLKIAFIVPELADAYWVAGEQGAKTEAKKDNVALTVTGTNTFTPSAYNAIVQDEISAGVNGLLIAPGDPVASNALIAQARRDNIAVATVVVDAPTSKRQFFIGPDATLIGQGQGQRVVAYLHAQHATGQVQMAILSCSPTALSQVQEHVAMVKAVTTSNPYKSQFTVKVVTFLNSTADPTTNLAAYDNVASAYPKLKVVVGECGLDPPSAGLVNQRRHLHWIVGGDSTLLQTLNLVNEGYVTWTMNEEPYETLQSALNSMARALRGQASMPNGVKFLPLTVYVKNVGYMKSIGLPGPIESIAQARRSPDATG